MEKANVVMSKCIDKLECRFPIFFKAMWWATLATISLFLSCGAKGTEVKKVIVHDTIYKDSFPMIVHDTIYYNAKWLRQLFETAEWEVWKNYADDYEVEYPVFMEKVELMKGERNMCREFHGISMVVCAYDDQIEMSVKEKYEAINMSAVTKSIADSSFLMAGRCGEKITLAMRTSAPQTRKFIERMKYC